MSSLPVVIILHCIMAFGFGAVPYASTPASQSAQPAPIVKIDTAMQQERVVLPDGSVHELTTPDLSPQARVANQGHR